VQQKSETLPINITERTYISSALVAVPFRRAMHQVALTSCHAIGRPLHDSTWGTLLPMEWRRRKSETILPIIFDRSMHGSISQRLFIHSRTPSVAGDRWSIRRVQQKLFVVRLTSV